MDQDARVLAIREPQSNVIISPAFAKFYLRGMNYCGRGRHSWVNIEQWTMGIKWAHGVFRNLKLLNSFHYTFKISLTSTLESAD